MKQLLTFLLCFSIPLSLCGCGKTAAQPEGRTASSIVVSDTAQLKAALSEAVPGDTIFLREGRYEGHFVCEVSGTEASPVTLRSCEGERAILAVPDHSDGAALDLNGCRNLIISGLAFTDMQAKKVYGILMTGGESGIVIRSCEFSCITTTVPGDDGKTEGEANAVLLLGETREPIRNVTIENNRIHDNVNGWSENISIAGNCESVFVRNNEIFGCTNIGIDFYGNAEYCPDPELDRPRDCECTGNTVYRCICPYAENAGIYVDGAYDILVEGNEMYANPYGLEIGSEEWRPYYSDDLRVRNITVRNNFIHDNLECGLRLGGWTDDGSTGIVQDCNVTGNSFSGNPVDVILAKCDTISFEENEFSGDSAPEEAVVFDDAISADKITNILFR